MSATAIVVTALLLIVIWCLLVLIGRLAAQAATFGGPLAALVDALAESNAHLQALDDHFTAGPITLGHKVTVHTKKPDDQSIHGLLLHEYQDRLELVDAHFVADPEKTVIPGVVRIATGNIAFRQDHLGTADAPGS